MNENAKKWIKALKSGKYKQGNGYLREGDKYCCLGVACELYIEDGNQLFVEKPNPDNDVYLYDGAHSSLPEVVLKWLGLRDPLGTFNTAISNEIRLSGLNDSGVSFKEIATIIKSEPEGLFV
jgi:hypothetical protein